MVFDFSVTAGTLFALASLVTGVVLGVMYDVFRVVRLVLPKGRVLLFVLDMVYCLCAACVFMLVCFNYGYGEFRWYSFVFAGGAFWAYYRTVGRLVYALACKTVELIMRPLRALCAAAERRIALGRARGELRRLIRCAGNGFTGK